MTTFARSSTERAIFTKWEPRTSAAVSRSASSGGPAEAGTAQTEAVRGTQRHLFAGEAHVHAGQHRGGSRHGPRRSGLGDGLREGFGVHLANLRRQLRQIRVLALRHELQRERGRAEVMVIVVSLAER